MSEEKKDSAAASPPAPPSRPRRQPVPVWLISIVAIFVMVGGVGVAWFMSGGLDSLLKQTVSHRGDSSPTPSSTFSPTTAASPTEAPVPVASAIPVNGATPVTVASAIPVNSNTPMPVASAIPINGATPMPVASAVPVDENVAPPMALTFDPNAPESQGVRNEVLKRIDIMPNLAPEKKDKLYTEVDRARSMGCLIRIPFGSGRAELTAADIENLKRATQAPQVQKMLEDPTVVFVVLGYADKKGNDSANFKVSLARAESVLGVLRDKCGFQNVMHAVAMGGSDFFDPKQAEKNRLVELWAVLP